MSDNDNFGSFFSGLLLGGIAGAVVALLLAPQAGEETRKLVKEKSIELRDKVANYAEEVLTQAEKTVGDVSAAIDDTMQSASEVAEKGQVILESKKEKTPSTKKIAKSE
ncbi:MAG TPA: YtxH domain-containing protein [Anaerolineaceae bacterium]|jgi:gas vesicle protein|nr:YtxH domain-containing protein [Anaerolineaceae bacterium]